MDDVDHPYHSRWLILHIKEAVVSDTCSYRRFVESDILNLYAKIGGQFKNGKDFKISRSSVIKILPFLDVQNYMVPRQKKTVISLLVIRRWGPNGA